MFEIYKHLRESPPQTVLRAGNTVYGKTRQGKNYKIVYISDAEPGEVDSFVDSIEYDLRCLQDASLGEMLVPVSETARMRSPAEDITEELRQICTSEKK